MSDHDLTGPANLPLQAIRPIVAILRPRSLGSLGDKRSLLVLRMCYISRVSKVKKDFEPLSPRREARYARQGSEGFRHQGVSLVDRIYAEAEYLWRLERAHPRDVEICDAEQEVKTETVVHGIMRPHEAEP